MFELFKKIFTRKEEKQEQEVDSQIKPTAYEVQSYGYNSNGNFNREYLNELRGWVSSCVTAISDKIASSDIKLYEVKGEKVHEILDHPILDNLYKVNSFTTKFDHFWLTQAYLELTGEAPWFLDKSGNKVNGVYLLRPDKLIPFPGKGERDRIIDHYKYDIGRGKRITLQADEVIFIRYPDPVNPFRGIGTLKQASKTVDIDNASEIWNYNFYNNAARPGSVLTVPDNPNMSKEQKEKLKHSIKEAYQGLDNSHKTMVLFGGMELKEFGFSQKDMDFLEQQRFSRDKILGIFRVPKAIVSQTEGVNLASAKVSEIIFSKYVIKPKLERLVEQLNEFFVPIFSGTENMYLEFEDPVPEDVEKKDIHFETALKSGWMTINEVRRENNLPDIQGGDVIRYPSDLIEIGESEKKIERDINLGIKKHYINARNKNKREIKKVKNQLKKKIKLMLVKEIQNDNLDKTKTQKERYRIRKNIKNLIEKELKKENNQNEKSKKLTDEKKYEFWEMKDKLSDKYHKNVKKEINNIFIQQKKKVLDKLKEENERDGKSIKRKQNDKVNINNILLDESSEIKLTIESVLPELTQLYEESANETFDFLNVDMTMDVSREEVDKLLKAEGRKFSKSAVETTNTAIRTQITEGLSMNEGIQDLSKRVRNVFTEATENRSELIARTETIKYNNSAIEQSFIDSGIIEAKQWVTNPGACPICIAIEESVNSTPLGSNFFNKGNSIEGFSFDYEDIQTPPAHPNCRCVIAPIFKELS